MRAEVWVGCYKSGWQGLIVPGAFAHPAKFSRSLIARIYDHMREEGWLPPGSTVLDPFGGVGLGALDCMRIGCHFIGIELEQKFVDLAAQNIALWHRRFHRLPNWGTARVVQGDSRTLLAWQFAGPKVDGCISSPPYNGPFAQDHPGTSKGRRGVEPSEPGAFVRYGNTPGQLEGLPDRGFDAVVGSPPHGETLAGGFGAFDRAKVTTRQPGPHGIGGGGYGENPSNLGNLPPGNLDAVISSPPYAYAVNPHGEGPGMAGNEKRRRRIAEGGRTEIAAQSSGVGYGSSPGQLGQMREGSVEAVVSSPPWEKGAEGILRREKFRDPAAFAARMAQGKYRDGKTVATTAGRLAQMNRDAGKIYGQTDGQLGQETGDTFWSASRQILDQAFLAVRPGGHAVFVVKDYVRKGKRVPFADQWRQLCEAVGFRTLHCHRALLVEDNGTQGRTDGSETRLRTERKSFFRRLSEFHARARKHWPSYSRQEQAGFVIAARRAWWEDHWERMAKFCEEYELPRQYNRRQIRADARAMGYRAAGQPEIHTPTDINWETVWCLERP